jgi:hypothetical protein
LTPLAPSHRVRYVDSFEALVAARFEGDVNALCWPRQLPGDFQAVINALQTGEGMTTIDDDDLRALSLGFAGAVARNVLLTDQALLREAGLAPILDCIVGYPRDDAAGPISTDVYSFHVDSAPVAADTYLCTYIGAASEGLDNEKAVRRVDVAETRTALLKSYGGADDEGFAAFLSAKFFNLHYTPRGGALPYSFGIGNLWRIAIAHPTSPVLPCIHRAPLSLPGAAARLLMIS